MDSKKAKDIVDKCRQFHCPHCEVTLYFTTSTKVVEFLTKAAREAIMEGMKIITREEAEAQICSEELIVE